MHGQFLATCVRFYTNQISYFLEKKKKSSSLISWFENINFCKHKFLWVQKIKKNLELIFAKDKNTDLGRGVVYFTLFRTFQLFFRNCFSSRFLTRFLFMTFLGIKPIRDGAYFNILMKETFIMWFSELC